MDINNQPIGIFDSGVGGLTVLQELKKLLPNEQFIYFGDTAHVPYGNKSKTTIEKYCLNIVDFLNTKKVKLIIVACNSASSTALHTIKKHTSTPMLNVIDPCVYAAIKNTKNNQLGVIGTPTTIASKAYNKKIKTINPLIKVYSQQCPLFVPIIEENLFYHPIVHQTAQLYLEQLPQTIDSLILGCTHYPLIKNVIKQHLNPQTVILDSSIIMAQHVKGFLQEKNLEASTQKQTIQFYVSDDAKKFRKTAKKIMENFNSEVQQIIL